MLTIWRGFELSRDHVADVVANVSDVDVGLRSCTGGENDGEEKLHDRR
jgi:hypothetical protein